MDLKVSDLGAQSELIREQAAALLVEGFDEPRGWPTLELAREVASVLRDGFARAIVEESTLVGWIGGLPEYAGRVWELHPMVVRREYRRRGTGRSLVAAFATLLPGSCQMRMAADDLTSTCRNVCSAGDLQVSRSVDL